MIREEIAKEISLKEEIDRIKTVPGIGDITAWMIAAMASNDCSTQES